MGLTLAPLLGRRTAAFQRAFSWVNQRARDAYPTGVGHGTFHSPVHKTDVGYCIYLPPSYNGAGSGANRYPVVYYLHGGFVGSELAAIGLAAPVDAAMRQGRVPEAIYVFPNGGMVSHYDYPALRSYGETALIKELIPHIDSTYRTIPKREGRGIEGFSAGGRGTARIMFKYPELFCSAAPIGGGHQFEKYIQEHEGRSQNPPDMVFDQSDNTYDLARRYASRGTRDLKILVVVGTTDQNYAANVEWLEHLDSLNIGHRKIVVEGVGHNAAAMYERAGLDVMRFHADSR